MVNPKSESLLTQWTKVLLALGVQTLGLVYYFSATLTRLETELSWVKNRQLQNFEEHGRLVARIDELSDKFQEHCIRQERDLGSHMQRERSE